MWNGTNFPHGFARGVTIRQVPILNLYSQDVLWVNVNSAVNSDGSFRRPYADLDTAIGKADAGDLIVIKAGHTENIADATSFQCDKAGIHILGLGLGNRKPTFSMTAAAGTIQVDSANVVVENIKVVANFETGVTTAVNLAAAADGFALIDCDFRDTSATFEFLIHVTVATTFTDLFISGCTFITAAGTMSSSIFFAGSSTDCLIVDNMFYVDASASIIDHLTTASVNLILAGNRMANIDTGAGLGVSIKTGGTGYGFDNYIFGNKNDSTPLVGDAMTWEQNSVNNTLANSGILFPAAVAAVP